MTLLFAFLIGLFAGEGFMLARLTRQRDMLKIEGIFNTFRERVAGYNMSAGLFLQPGDTLLRFDGD